MIHYIAIEKMDNVFTSLILHKVASYLDPKSIVMLSQCCRLFSDELTYYTSSICEWCSHKHDLSTPYISNFLIDRVTIIKNTRVQQIKDFGKYIFISDDDLDIRLQLYPNINTANLVIMTQDANKVYDVIAYFVSTCNLKAICIEPYNNDYMYVLSDKHTVLLANIDYVRLNTNCSLTDQTLYHLRHARVVEIRGCKNISGAILPSLFLDPTTKLYAIMWWFGYGTRNIPFANKLHYTWVILQATRVGTFIGDYPV